MWHFPGNCSAKQKRGMTEGVNSSRSISVNTRQRAWHSEILLFSSDCSTEVLQQKRRDIIFDFLIRPWSFLKGERRRWGGRTMGFDFLPFHLLTHCSDNTCLLQAWCEQGESALQKWVMESERGRTHTHTHTCTCMRINKLSTGGESSWGDAKDTGCSAQAKTKYRWLTTVTKVTSCFLFTPGKIILIKESAASFQDWKHRYLNNWIDK